MIAIIDYGMGNIRSVQKAFGALGCETIITDDPNIVARAEKLVLPGVGAFGDAMETLRGRALDRALHRALDRGAALLGLCLGMQLLFSESEEFGRHRGLDIFAGRVKRLEVDLPVPHVGWNRAEIVRPSPLLAEIESGEYFYFVHSYYVSPEDSAVVAAETEYGINFPSVVGSGRIWGAQFHPEKSQRAGLKLLRNFVGL